MKRLALLLLLVFLALAIWLAASGGGARRDPVERLVADMVQIPGRDYRMGKFEVTQAQWDGFSPIIASHCACGSSNLPLR